MASATRRVSMASSVVGLVSLFFGVLFFLGLWASPAMAQVTVQASSTKVEVGESFSVQLTAMTEGGKLPSNPDLRVPAGFTVSGPQIASRMSVRMGVGGTVQQQGIAATWRLIGTKVGRFNFRQPTVFVDGKMTKARGRLRIEVVAIGKGRRKRRTSPFRFGFGLGGTPDPFAKMFPEIDDEPPPMTARGERLSMRTEPDAFVFLRLVPNKKRVVVGEQVTLTSYVYYRRDFRMTDKKEPLLPDFLRVPMDQAPGTAQELRTQVGGLDYSVRQLDQIAVFPVRSGTLKTGAIAGSFQLMRRRGTPTRRASNDVTIVVEEPPLASRPPGYRLGDVGRFKLQADVRPRQTIAGESVAITVRVTGFGQLPTELKIPERKGVEWLPPEKTQEQGVRNGRITGRKTFAYAVRFSEPGLVDLGNITLPYYDPVLNRYNTASAKLGQIVVKPGKGTANSPKANASGEPSVGSTDDDVVSLEKLGAPRTKLATYETPSDKNFEPRWFWPGLLLPPFGVALLGVLGRTSRRVRRRRREAKKGPRSRAKAALAELVRLKDPAGFGSAAERTLHLAIEAATGLRSRGILLDQLATRLTAVGVESSLADELVAVARACGDLRFAPDLDQANTGDLKKRTRAAAKELLKIDLSTMAPGDADSPEEAA